jgi:hypothetical protein
MIVYHPTEPNAISWARQKWRIFVRGTRALAKLFPIGKSRDAGNSLLYQERADGRGHVEIAGANSPAALVAALEAEAGPGRPVEVGAQQRRRPRGAGRQPLERLRLGEELQDLDAAGEPRLPHQPQVQALDPGRVPPAVPALRHMAPLLWDNFRLSVEAIMDARKHGRPRPGALHLHGCGAAIEEKHRARDAQGHPLRPQEPRGRRQARHLGLLRLGGLRARRDLVVDRRGLDRRVRRPEPRAGVLQRHARPALRDPGRSAAVGEDPRARRGHRPRARPHPRRRHHRHDRRATARATASSGTARRSAATAGATRSNTA